MRRFKLCEGQRPKLQNLKCVRKIHQKGHRTSAWTMKEKDFLNEEPPEMNYEH